MYLSCKNTEGTHNVPVIYKAIEPLSRWPRRENNSMYILNEVHFIPVPIKISRVVMLCNFNSQSNKTEIKILYSNKTIFFSQHW